MLLWQSLLLHDSFAVNKNGEVIIYLSWGNLTNRLPGASTKIHLKKIASFSNCCCVKVAIKLHIDVVKLLNFSDDKVHVRPKMNSINNPNFIQLNVNSIYSMNERQ